MRINNLEKCMHSFRKVNGISYSVLDSDEYGDCNSCVNHSLGMEFGIESKGIFLKNWTKGMNASTKPLEELDSIYISHDITEEQAKQFYNIFGECFDISPKEYDKTCCFELRDK